MGCRVVGVGGSGPRLQYMLMCYMNICIVESITTHVDHVSKHLRGALKKMAQLGTCHNRGRGLADWSIHSHVRTNLVNNLHEVLNFLFFIPPLNKTV